MKFEQFKEFAKSYNLIPVYKVITADMLTPVLAYLKIRKPGTQSFLLESVEGSANMARFSFIGIAPEKIISNIGIKLSEKSNGHQQTKDESIFSFIKKEIKRQKQPKIDSLPGFTGGLVGFLGYENISHIEKVITFNSYDSSIPDSIFGNYKTILVFDHYKHQIILISNAAIKPETNIETAYQSALNNIERLRKELAAPKYFLSDFKLDEKLNNDFNTDEFFTQVEKSKTHISEGDIFQIVLSKRFSAGFTGDAFNVYRALRIINPSPYMYFLEFEHDYKIIGTSPEDLVRVNDKQARTLPIAGTRRRGKTEEEDLLLEEELKNDPKELAEHTMLVDLGRNDLGRVCKYGTINVTDKMKIVKYSHVMHMVSKVAGELLDDKDAVDALMACFPAGTVSGAPKIKAVELIEKYEKLRRNIYAGAVGYFDFSGNMDMCIAIRTLYTQGNKIYWQAGAGIVADSRPELEVKEIKNKSAAMVKALKYAEVIDENNSNR
ncbi:MAG: anthranilate synthase component I [Ignavibacteria bacterium CG_4_9_14_3_um_filter_36_18]|nr:anthranilate synthase component I [Ignavibacteria bacterium]PJB02169.1 MAG: anthranilate synthase component I [Ignavibacteria bacterium CG_4_9_14_3_um_filter_36_18]